ncbi:outer dense fiber protein 3 [Falco rusticolus]|uniref:outer dense fiber protein 3 n=1 Tax=Falco rusticolus TaxID=120794 RepID=UPI00188655E4|nr:outer dense fiber protein 3 [Falco rusticolus]
MQIAATLLRSATHRRARPWPVPWSRLRKVKRCCSFWAGFALATLRGSPSAAPAVPVGFVAASDTDGAWVGTWRPHRPRSFISAQFTTPAPKYSIPGTTGYLAHSPTKVRAPAYTFPMAKRPVASSCSPGPCYYVPPAITRHGKYVVPAQHMAGLPKTKSEVAPGPGDYSIEKANKHVYMRPPAQPMAFRHEAAAASTVPGKGMWGAQTPAPACPPGGLCWAAACAMGLGTSLPGRTQLVPANMPHATEDGGAGRRGRTPFLPSRCYPGAAPCAAGLTDALPFPLPGVGTYMLPRLVGHNTACVPASPCYSMKGKSKHYSYLEGMPKVSCALSSGCKGSSCTSMVRVGSARTNTHLGHPASSTPLLQTPGPAAFPKVDLDTYKNRAPRYTMGSRTRLGGDKTVKPGPADYCPGKVTLTKPQAPAPTFGLRHSRYTTPLILPL